MTRRLTPAAAAAWLLCAWVAPATSQSLPPAVPDAGQLLREQRQGPSVAPPPAPAVQLPAPSATPSPAADAPAAGPRFSLRMLRVRGATAFTQERLQAEIADLVGRDDASLASLEQAAQRITRLYREAGYPLARAFVPAQSVQGGIAELAVLEGVLGGKAVDNRSALSTEAVRRLLAPLAEGEPVRTDAVNRALLLLAEQPGAGAVEGAFRPGAVPGSTELAVALGSRRAWDASVSADNHGNRFTGRHRITAVGAWYGLDAPGERLELAATAAGGRTASARAGWDTLLAPSGLRGGFAMSASRYALGEDYAALDAHGTAHTAGLFATLPWLRAPAHRLDASARLERRWLSDRVGAVQLRTDKHADVLGLGLQGERGIGEAGVLSAAAQLSAGRLVFEHAASGAQDAAGARTAGGYAKLAWQAGYEQALTQGLRGVARLQGQVARKNLDSSEKFSLGAYAGVRAHPQGEASGDAGWLARLELRQRVAPQWELGLGWDAGRVRVNRRPFDPLAANTLRREGWALTGEGRVGSASIALALAWRGGAPPTSDRDRRPRLWFNTSWSF